MDFVWSPWRYTYVSSANEAPSCVFCIGNDPAGDDERLVLCRGTHNFVMMNLYPYTAGHLLIAPYRHLGSLAAVRKDELTEMMQLARRSVAILEDLYRPEGFNIGMNLGACAGAGVREHIHQHVVPRWCGDANFMTTTGETRVLPEALEVSFGKLKPLFSSRSEE